MWNFFDINYKKLTSFKEKEILQLESLLYGKYAYTEGIHIDFNSSENEELISYLIKRGYFYHYGEELRLTVKGSLICKQGGITLLWEKSKIQNFYIWGTLITLIISLIALYLSIFK